MYSMTKTFGAELGLSCAFRQWRANLSHCSFIHGYSLGFRVVISNNKLDSRNWVFDFGNFKGFKNWLEDAFDHKTLVAADDPLLPFFKQLHDKRGLDLVVVEAVGCEKFATMAYNKFYLMLEQMKELNMADKGCTLVSVECFEHGANSATYYGKKQ